VAAHIREAVVSAVLAGARREVLGFFRRRESFWLVVGFGVGCAAPAAVLGLGPRVGGENLAQAFPLSTAQLAAEVVHNYVSLAELATLVVLAIALASRSIAEEVDRGSWPLIRLTAAGVERTLAGKALGIAIVLAAVHGFAASLLLLMTPFLRRTPVEIAGATLGVLLIAVLAIPEGFAHPPVRRAPRSRRVLVRTVSVLRYVLMLAALAVLFGPPLQPRPTFDGYTSYWTTLPARGPALPATASPWLFALCWLAFSGALVWKLAVRRWGSGNE
jgi:hypothetical protein